MTEVGLGRGKRREGALFVSLPRARGIGLFDVKLPRSSGINVAGQLDVRGLGAGDQSVRLPGA